MKKFKATLIIVLFSFSGIYANDFNLSGYGQIVFRNVKWTERTLADYQQ
jgi:hypothetical protein